MKNILKVIQNSDNKFIFELRKNLYIRKNFSHSNLNNYIDHLTWYNKVFKKNKKNFFFIIQINTKKIGYIKYEFIQKKYFISIAVEKNYQNQGVAKLALKESEKFFKNKKIFAYVFIRNKKSLNFFISSGFKIIHTDPSYVYLEKLIK